MEHVFDLDAYINDINVAEVSLKVILYFPISLYVLSSIIFPNKSVLSSIELGYSILVVT